MRDLGSAHAAWRGGDAIVPAGGDTGRGRNLARRMRWIERAAGPLPGRRVLDAGCGAGDYVSELLARGADARGIEIDADKLLKSRAGSRTHGRLIQGDLERMPFASASFDLVLLNEVLEHVPDDAAALREAFRMLRPGGALIVFAPNRLFPFETHGVYARRSQRRISHAVPGVPWLPKALGRRFLRYWARNYWPWQLARMLRDSGFAIRQRGFAWPTFEDISGHQPRWMRPLAAAFRLLATCCEQMPGVRAFGSSQLLIACKGEGCG